MATGYEVAGVDLNLIFDPLHAGWPQAGVTDYEVGGADLNTIFAPLSTGDAAAVTGYEVASADLNTIFAGFGTTGVVVATQPSAVSGSAAAGNPSGSVTSNTTTCAGSKGSGAYTYAWHIASGSATFTAPSSATTGVTNSAVPAGDTLTGTMYCTISDGVTSANTNTVIWSLQNTTPNAWIAVINAGQNSAVPPYEFGLGALGNYGTIVSGGTFEGLTLVAVGDIHANMFSVPVEVYLTLGGFSSDPGQSWFSTLTVNGHTFTSSSASYTYDSFTGQGAWTWPGDAINFIVGDNYTVTIAF